MQTPTVSQSLDPQYKLTRQIRQAARAFVDDRITTEELIKIVSKLKAASGRTKNV